jgi:ferric-dicitrate binding protein FerR (iron transport regulator)
MNFFQNNNDILFEKLGAYYLNELPEEEMIIVRKWIEESDHNAKQYKAIEQMLQQYNDHVEELDIDVDAAWAKFNQKKSIAGNDHKGKVIGMKRYWVAAAVILGIVIGGWALFDTAKVFSNEEWIAKTNFDTLQLPDGSIVIASGNATIQYKQVFNKSDRIVKLEGGAYFKVQKNTSLPFSVSFEEGKVTVLGTQFQVDQKSSGFSVKVTEGKVRAELLHQKGEVILTRGKMVSFNKDNKSFIVESFADRNMLRYNNEVLQTILKDILLAKGITIRAEESLANIKLTVDFAQSSMDDILQTLELLTQGRLTKTGHNQYDLTRD